LDDFKQEAQETFAGERPDSRTFFFICKLDDKAEADNPAMWEKANPALRYFPELQRVITQQYNDYKNIPELWRGFITKRMNMPAQDTAAPVTDFVNIAAARNQLLPDGAERWADSTAFDGWPCIGGLDYAETSDYVGCGLLFRKLEKYYWLHHSFICAASLLKVKPSFSIEEAVDLGLCTIIKHQNIPAEMIAEWFTDKSNKYSIQRVAFDSYREAVVKKAFSDAGIVTDVIRKGSFTHAKIAPLLDVLYGNHNIIYGGDRMMSWYTNNVYKAYDGKGNVSYEKVEPIRRKTDGWHAFLAAMCSDFDKALPDGGPVNFASMRVRTY
jgi:phage terminase large subunit-like protein